MDNNADHELGRLRNSGNEELAECFRRHEDRLRKMISFRLDRRVAVRVAADDILQECFLEASRRLEEYLSRPDVPLFIWLRFLANQQVAVAHRRHRKANRRSVAKEINKPFASTPSGSSILHYFLASLTTPSLVLAKQELETDVRKHVEELDATDREILTLRHFEELSNTEAAIELSVSPGAASKRYLRALEKLRASFRDQRE